MTGQRHLIECHCVLPLYKKKKPVKYHKFAVYSKFDNKTGKVIPKYVNCNNCGITHLVNELCRSQIIIGKEDILSVRTIKDISVSLSPILNKILEDYNATVDVYEEVEEIIDLRKYPSNIIIKREIIEEEESIKLLQINEHNKIKIIQDVINTTIIIKP